jgi:hypothetical protein
MPLSGNRFIQQKAVEKNMSWHYQRVKQPKAQDPTFCRWTEDNPQPVPSKAQKRKAADAKKHIEQVLLFLYCILF